MVFEKDMRGPEGTPPKPSGDEDFEQVFGVKLPQIGIKLPNMPHVPLWAIIGVVGAFIAGVVYWWFIKK